MSRLPTGCSIDAQDKRKHELGEHDPQRQEAKGQEARQRDHGRVRVALGEVGEARDPVEEELSGTMLLVAIPETNGLN